MVGHLPLTSDLTTVPLPRRPPDATASDDDPVRRWYENELGWPTVPGDSPGSLVRLRVGLRFDVLDIPAVAGHAALRHLTAGSPVAVRGDRMLLLVAAGSADELPGILEWLDWGTLPLDLHALGPDDSMEAPPPPETTPAGLGGGHDGWAETTRDDHRPDPRIPTDARRDRAPGQDDSGERSPTSRPGGSGGRLPMGRPGGAEERSAGAGPGWVTAAGLPGGATGAGVRPLVLGRPGALQGAAVWLRPPEPGCEVEASLPTMSALGRAGSAPDLVRVVDTVATQCHQLRLRARP
ncbi:SCO3374 family protein [Streptomyces griseorubiginosus]|uniref:SCO3374 family protein n=1 Tax=Streptomyces griseorubiginosus TaxID=67304 RepID=UPI002E80A01D|nr:SCO3374 family protein [Streptomyces griseorubiginosus]WUB45217.1 SCO3374 family protein [Streptomyces griseorubiginosus]WUB53734.1 SCO3374 family protein [Streptomyces griseorubiginosus]